jgi:hypothetical protein
MMQKEGIIQMKRSVSSDAAVKVAPKFSWKKLASGAIVLDLENGEYFTLNDTAALIFEGLSAGKDREAIIGSVVEAYEVSPEKARQGVDEAIGRLVHEGILVAQGASTM